MKCVHNRREIPMYEVKLNIKEDRMKRKEWKKNNKTTNTKRAKEITAKINKTCECIRLNQNLLFCMTRKKTY